MLVLNVQQSRQGEASRMEESYGEHHLRGRVASMEAYDNGRPERPLRSMNMYHRGLGRSAEGYGDVRLTSYIQRMVLLGVRKATDFG